METENLDFNKNLKSLFDLYKEHQGKVSDKWISYIANYDRIFSRYRRVPITLLEIGVQNGGSLEIWSKYFPKYSKLVGCDINQDCANLKYDDSRIVIVIGDANSKDAQNKIKEQCQNFKIIIDDGSHFSSDIIRSFCAFFPLLDDDGIYVIEDLHCSYWQEFEGGVFAPFSSWNFLIQLTHIVNYEHWGISEKRSEVLADFFEKYDLDIAEKHLAQIHSIEFINSMCMIHKSSEQMSLVGPRYIAGTKEEVLQNFHNLHLLSIHQTDPHPQSQNPLAKKHRSLEEKVELQQKIISENDSLIKNLNSQILIQQEDLNELKVESRQIDLKLKLILNSARWKLLTPLRWLDSLF